MIIQNVYKKVFKKTAMKNSSLFLFAHLHIFLFANYLAIFTALFSLITVTFICPGKVISVCIFCAISKLNVSLSASVTLSASTITLSSLPACIAYAFSTPLYDAARVSRS